MAENASVRIDEITYVAVLQYVKIARVFLGGSGTSLAVGRARRD
jgi:hypothetical protein